MKKYIFFGSIVFVLSLLIYIPSSIASKFFPKNITASQFQGNLWNGSASSLSINKVNLGSISWKVKPACFLLFKLCVDVKQNKPTMNSSFLLKTRGGTELHNLKAQGDTAIFTPMLSKQGITASGNFIANFSKISFNDNQIQTINGKLQFLSLALNGVLRVSLGDLESVFEAKEDHTHIQIMNQEGHVDLTGIAQLYTDLRYQVDMTIQKNVDSTDAVINGLQYVGEAQSDGSVRLKQNGKLTI